MEVSKLWKGNDVNKYYIITLDKETNEWKFFREIVGHTVFWQDEPSRYGMTKSKAIEVLNIVKFLTNEDINNKPTPTEPETTEPSTDTPTEPSENNTDTSTSTDGETSTGKNNNGETSSEGNTEPITDHVNGNGTNTEPTTTVTEPQYKIITISSVTYNSVEAPTFDAADYHKLKTTLTYLETTYPNDNISVEVTETDTRKSIFYFYLKEELTWFLELKTNIDYALVSNITTLDDIKELL